MTKKAREILRRGATQIKIAGGGGVTSTYDPLDVTQYSYEEMKAIVDVAKKLEHVRRSTYLYRRAYSNRDQGGSQIDRTRHADQGPRDTADDERQWSLAERPADPER